MDTKCVNNDNKKTDNEKNEIAKDCWEDDENWDWD